MLDGPGVGFAVAAGQDSDAGHWVYTGDTGPNPLLWQRLRQMKVAHLVIETAFKDVTRNCAKMRKTASYQRRCGVAPPSSST